MRRTCLQSHTPPSPAAQNPYLPAISVTGIKGRTVRRLIRYCLRETSSLMCHNSLSEPCPHLVRWLMGISIIGFPQSRPFPHLFCASRLRRLPYPPKIPRGAPDRSVWNKCHDVKRNSDSGVNAHRHGARAECRASSDKRRCCCSLGSMRRW